MKTTRYIKPLTVLVFIMLLVAMINRLVIAQSGIEYNPEQTRLAISGNEAIIGISGRVGNTAVTQNLIDFYDASNGELVTSFDAGEYQVEGLTIDTEGELVAFSNNFGGLFVFSISTVIEVSSVMDPGFTDVGGAQFSPDGSLLAFYSGRAVPVYTTTNFHSYVGLIDDASDAIVVGFGWHPFERRVAISTLDRTSSAREIVIWNIIAQSEAVIENRIPIDGGSIVVWSPDGNTIAINKRGGVLVITVADNEMRTLAALDTNMPIRTLAWHPDSGEIAGGGDGVIYIWNLETGDVVKWSTPAKIE